MRKTTLLAGIALLMSAGAASAHTGVGATGGFAHGFLHPIGGLDHVLAMVTVGGFAALLGGRAIWLVPAAFVSMMIVGGIMGVSGVGLPFVEAAIALSIVVLGGALAFGRSIPVVLAMALAGLFAVFHGHAHGTEMPVAASGLVYGAGFVLATALLHAAGLGAGLAASRLGGETGARLTRITGAVVAVAGLSILTGIA